VAQERAVGVAGGRRVGSTLRLTDSTEIAIRIDWIVRTPKAFRLPGRRPRRRRVFQALVAVAYTLVVTAILAVALAGPAAGRPVDLAPRGAEGPLLPASAASRVSAGQALSLRAPSHPRTAYRPDPPGLGTHVVGPGETLFGIAMKYGVSPQTLAFNNGFTDTAELRPGLPLLITPPDVVVYDVAENDTILGIAQRFGVTAERIAVLNGIEFEPTDLLVGRRLVIPVVDPRFPGFRLKVSEAPVLVASRLRYPVLGFISQRFSRGHPGIDIAAPTGTPVVASDDGTVTAAGWHEGTGGLHVCVRHDWGLETCMHHNSAVLVEVGERVLAGQIVARVGSTGHSTGPHVHWEARTNGALVDPLTWIGGDD
jgi:murein DD-endopeptidase MepM/ murein hydrolase activator NlpD